MASTAEVESDFSNLDGLDDAARPLDTQPLARQVGLVVRGQGLGSERPVR